MNDWKKEWQSHVGDTVVCAESGTKAFIAGSDAMNHYLIVKLQEPHSFHRVHLDYMLPARMLLTEKFIFGEDIGLVKNWKI